MTERCSCRTCGFQLALVMKGAGGDARPLQSSEQSFGRLATSPHGCFGPILAYPPSSVEMGGSRRPGSDQHFIFGRDGELKTAQRALQARAKDATVLHSTLSQTTLLVGCLPVGCWDFNFWVSTVFTILGSKV